MIRLLVSFSLLLFVAIVSMGGCDGGGSGDGMEPEPTPVPTLLPTPTPGSGDCDFVPDESGQLYTEEDCAELTQAFNCADFSFQSNKCEVFGCEDCLCDATSQIAQGVIGPFGCALAAAISNCFNPFFDEGSNECTLLVCVHEAPCGPFEILIP